MYRRHGDKLVVVFLACDLAVTAAVWLGAYLLRFAAVAVARRRARLPPGARGPADRAGAGRGGLPALRAVRGPSPAAAAPRVGRRLQGQRAAVPAGDHGDLLPPRPVRVATGPGAVPGAQRRRADARAADRLAGGEVPPRPRAELRPGGDRRRRADRAPGGPDHPGQRLDRPGGGRLRRSAAASRDRRCCRGWATSTSWTGSSPSTTSTTCSSPCRLSRYGELPEVYRALSDVLVEVQLVPDVPNLAGMKLRMLEIDDVAFLESAAEPALRLAPGGQAGDGPGRWARRRWCCSRR